MDRAMRTYLIFLCLTVALFAFSGCQVTYKSNVNCIGSGVMDQTVISPEIEAGFTGL